MWPSRNDWQKHTCTRAIPCLCIRAFAFIWETHAKHHESPFSCSILLFPDFWKELKNDRVKLWMLRKLNLFAKTEKDCCIWFMNCAVKVLLIVTWSIVFGLVLNRYWRGFKVLVTHQFLNLNGSKREREKYHKARWFPKRILPSALAVNFSPCRTETLVISHVWLEIAFTACQTFSTYPSNTWKLLTSKQVRIFGFFRWLWTRVPVRRRWRRQRRCGEGGDLHSSALVRERHDSCRARPAQRGRQGKTWRAWRRRGAPKWTRRRYISQVKKKKKVNLATWNRCLTQ